VENLYSLHSEKGRPSGYENYNNNLADQEEIIAVGQLKEKDPKWRRGIKKKGEKGGRGAPCEMWNLGRRSSPITGREQAFRVDGVLRGQGKVTKERWRVITMIVDHPGLAATCRKESGGEIEAAKVIDNRKRKKNRPRKEEKKKSRIPFEWCSTCGRKEVSRKNLIRRSLARSLRGKLKQRRQKAIFVLRTYVRPERGAP